MEKKATFEDVICGDLRYLIFYVHQRQDEGWVQKMLDARIDDLGAKMGTKAKIILSPPSASVATYEQVAKKKWSKREKDIIEKSEAPFIFIIQNDFADFDPVQNPYRIIIANFVENGTGGFLPVMHAIEKAIENDDDLFVALDHLSPSDNQSSVIVLQPVRNIPKGAGGNKKAYDQDLILKIYDDLFSEAHPPSSISAAATAIGDHCYINDLPTPSHSWLRNLLSEQRATT